LAKAHVEYNYLANSPAGFVQQIVCYYLTNGYHYYVYDTVKPGKDPFKLDDKLMTDYGIAVSKWTRSRRKKLGVAGVHYLRYRECYILIATKGEHVFFKKERKLIKNANKKPIYFMGYSISFRSGHASVRIKALEYDRLKAYFASMATERKGLEWWKEKWKRFPFEPYGPVIQQILALFRMVNIKRKAHSLPVVPFEYLRLGRDPIKTFRGSEPFIATKSTRDKYLEDIAKIAPRAAARLMQLTSNP
jgi:hypothetical protein